MGNIINNAKVQSPWAVLLLTGTLIASLAFVAVTFFLLAREARQVQEWISLATDVQISSQQLAKSAGEAASGNLDAFLELGNSRTRIASAMSTLRGGSDSSELPPVPIAVAEPMKQLSLSWDRMNTNTVSILDRENLILELASAHDIVQQSIPGIQKTTDDIIRALTQSGAPTDQVVFASRQLVLADRILRRASEVLQGGNNAIKAAEALENDRDLFNTVLKALLNGNRSLGVTRVRNSQALQSLGRVNTLFVTINPHIDSILKSSADLFDVRGAADEIFLDSRDVFGEAASLKNAISELQHVRIWPSQTTGAMGLALMIVMVWMLTHSFLNAERRRAKLASSYYQNNQQAILKLLDEMSTLAAGDLTVQATVSEEITGAIADAINFTVEQLRLLVKRIKYTAQEVSVSAMNTRASTSDLAEAAKEQAHQVGEATKTVQQMAKSFDSVADRSHESSDVARRSVKIAHTGGQKVRETISAMDTIREQIQQTSKRVKRLGESSQEIGDIVRLINDIAEQTNVLALNAAIQAASAGGVGRGFAVVADEVQHLAESATLATRRIETLVQTIQADTSEAVVSMESTTAEVVSGARLAEDAGKSLEKIQSVSKDLSELIDSISEEASTQSETATDMSEFMKGVQAVSVQSAEGSTQAADSVADLERLVMQLSNSVTNFKLPEED